MSSDPESQLFRSVTEGEVTVTKSYAPEEFPVPAIKFVVESTADEQVDVRIVDTIPAEFPMENVGFHPDFEKDNWTAYKSHQVEYDRSLDPGESVTTVYGIRLDDTEPSAFMTDPEVKLLGGDVPDSTDQTLDDVLGDDSNQVVRDVLSGERESLPGLEPDAEGDVTIDAPSVGADPETTADAVDAAGSDPESLELDFDADADADADADDDVAEDAPQPEAFDDSGRSATDQPAEAAITEYDEAESFPDDADADADDAADDVAEDLVLDVDEAERHTEEAEDDASAADGDDVDAAADEDDIPVKEAESRGPRVTAGSVLAALTDELARDDVDDGDLETLREALGVDSDADATVPRSVDLRIQRLQNQVEDLAAYSSGLEAFLDEEGTAEELIDEFRAEVEATTETVEALSERADRADDDRAALREDVGDVRTDVSELDDRVGDVDARLESVDDRLEGLDERVAAVDDRLESVDETVAAVDSRLEAVDSRLDGVDERLDDVGGWLEDVDERASRTEERAESLDEEMGEVHEELATLDADISETREQLTDEVDDLRTELDEQVAATLDEHTDEVEAVRDDVAALQSELEALDDTVEDFRAFRTRLSSALGPLAGGSPADEADRDEGDDADAEAAAEDTDETETEAEADDEGDDTEE